MEYWKEELFKTFLIEFPKYYEDSSADYFQCANLPSKLNLEEQKVLNNRIDLPKLIGCEKKLVLNELLKDRTKDKFTFYLIQTLEIDCEVNSFDKSKKTVFIEIAQRYFEQETWISPYLISKLFQRGYEIKEEDNQFVLDLYKKIKKQYDMDKWATLRFATKLNDKNKFEIAQTHTRELFTILSFKMGKPVHFNFPNLIGVANNAISHYRESGDIILKSIDVFGQTEKVHKLDQRKGTFKRKRLEYLENKPIQNREFEVIAIELFPELK
tara:strand:- start:6101 stop:6907 length:807 start_codon:yes stop_codon:yes gene_type:complete